MILKVMSKNLLKVTLNFNKNNDIKHWTIIFILLQAILVVGFSNSSLSDINEELIDSESHVSSPTLNDDFIQDPTTLR